MSAWNFKWFYYYYFFRLFQYKWLAVLEFQLNCRYFEVQDEVYMKIGLGLNQPKYNWLAYMKKATQKPVKFTRAYLLAHTWMNEWMIMFCGIVEVGTIKLFFFSPFHFVHFIVVIRWIGFRVQTSEKIIALHSHMGTDITNKFLGQLKLPIIIKLHAAHYFWYIFIWNCRNSPAMVIWNEMKLLSSGMQSQVAIFINWLCRTEWHLRKWKNLRLHMHSSKS